MAFFEADRRLYVTADRKRVVEEGDPKAAYLLLPKGGQMLEGDARKLGLLKQQPKPQNKAVAKVANK